VSEVDIVFFAVWDVSR